MKTENMTDEEKREAIAQACGWKDFEEEDGALMGHTMGEDGWLRWDIVPDYLNSLDAMHAAEKTLRGKTYAYEHALAIVVFKDLTDDDWSEEKGLSPNVCVWHATARQRAHAFLAVL